VEIVIGSEPVANRGLVAPEELLEDIGAGGVLDEGGSQGVRGIFLFGHQSCDQRGFENGDAALLPVATDESVYEAELDDAFGTEFVDVILGDVRKFGLFFSGDDAGSGVGAVFKGVETG